VLLGKVRQDGRSPWKRADGGTGNRQKSGPVVEPVKCLVAIATINGHRAKIILCFHLGRARALRTLREIIVTVMEAADIADLPAACLRSSFSFFSFFWGAGGRGGGEPLEKRRL